MSCTKKEYKKVALIIVTILVFLFVQIAFTACSDNLNTNENGNNAVEDNEDDSDSENNDNNDKDEPVEYVTVSISSTNFFKYFDCTRSYSSQRVFLYTVYGYSGRYNQYKYEIGSMYDFTRTCTFSFQIKDPKNKVTEYGIRGITLKVEKTSQWRGSSVNVCSPESGYASGTVTAMVTAMNEPLPNINYTFDIDMLYLRGEIIVPKDNVK